MPTKVLLVEDDPALSDAVREGLSDENMEMVVVSNVKDGLEQIRTQRPDAVVLDLMLAGESGFELLRAVRSQRDQTPILIISALGTTEQRVSGLMAGADDYLVKPFELKELHARIIANIRRNRSGFFSSANPHHSRSWLHALRKPTPRTQVRRRRGSRVPRSHGLAFRLAACSLGLNSR